MRFRTLYHYLSYNTSSKSQKIVSSIMFNLLLSQKLTEHRTFDYHIIVETAQGR